MKTLSTKLLDNSNLFLAQDNVLEDKSIHLLVECNGSSQEQQPAGNLRLNQAERLQSAVSTNESGEFLAHGEEKCISEGTEANCRAVRNPSTPPTEIKIAP